MFDSPSNKIVGSMYCQSVKINISDVDMTMEFEYINPATKEKEIVSRITLPIEGAKMIPELINRLLLEHREKRKASIKARS